MKKNKFLNEKEISNSNDETKNVYFIEGPAEKDLIGFNSYFNSLDMAISSGAKFIGLISDYGAGKSTVIKLMKKEFENYYHFARINLWNCKSVEDNEFLIHKNFLHQLTDELKLKNKNYYKKKINKNYRFFDIAIKHEIYIYLYILLVFVGLFSAEQMSFISLFTSPYHKTICYLLLMILGVIELVLYKPMINIWKFDSDKRDIDENDTKDLYNEIINDFDEQQEYSEKNPIRKKIVICIEELDRFDNYEIILQYLREFYKFYSETISKQRVVFIISIKSATAIFSNNATHENSKKQPIENDEHAEENNDSIEEVDNTLESTNETKIEYIKGIYEKVFDFILNLRYVNAQNYDTILIDLLNEKKEILPDEVKKKLPTENNMGEWTYLYKGKNIKIRDIKHRFNFALSLFFSVQENGVTPNIGKCLYLSYIEDYYNSSYQVMLRNPEKISSLITKYANKNDINNSDVIFDENVDDNFKDDFILGITSKYISNDYNLYLYKLPTSKKALNSIEEEFYNAIFYDEIGANIDDVVKLLSKNQIIDIINKRADNMTLPEVIFYNQQLLEISVDNFKKELSATFKKRYPLKTNSSNAIEIFKIVSKMKTNLYIEFLNIYKNSCLNDFVKNTTVDERLSIRRALCKTLGENITIFKEIFIGDNHLITSDELSYINGINKLAELINFEKVTFKLLEQLAVKINNRAPTYKNEMMRIISQTIQSEVLPSDESLKFICLIKFEKFNLDDRNRRYIYNKLQSKIDFSVLDNKIKVLKCLNYLTEDINLQLINHIKQNNNDNNMLNIYVDMIRKLNFIFMETVKYLSGLSTVYSFNEGIRKVFYEKEYYNYYVISTKLNTGIFDIEHDKLDKLEKYYISEFEFRKDWKTKLSDDMKRFLYHNVNFLKLTSERLMLFYDLEQTKNIIQAVINTQNRSFINQYIQKISKFKIAEEREIYYLIGTKKQEDNNFFTYKTIQNLKRIAKRDKNIEFLDSRKNLEELVTVN